MRLDEERIPVTAEAGRGHAALLMSLSHVWAGGQEDDTRVHVHHNKPHMPY